MSVYDSKGKIDKTKFVREAVLIPNLKRTWECIIKADDWTHDNKKGLHVQMEEVVHIHHVYRTVDARGKVTQDRFFRGARV